MRTDVANSNAQARRDQAYQLWSTFAIYSHAMHTVGSFDSSGNLADFRGSICAAVMKDLRFFDVENDGLSGNETDADVRRDSGRDICALISGGTLQGGIMDIALKSGSIRDVSVGSRAMAERLNWAIDSDGIKSVVDRIFPFEEAREAFRYQASPSLCGKVVVAIK
jgi:hypothetical protein